MIDNQWRLQMRCIALSAVVLFALAGCTTTYGPVGMTGGVSAEAVSSDTYRINAGGNGFTNAETIRDYALLKAAETTKAAGGTHFAVVNSDGTTQTVFSPDLLVKIDKPALEIVIKVLNGPAPGAISANEVIASVGPKVRRG